MNIITLEEAEKISGDPEAIKRNYLTQEVLDDAHLLACAVKKEVPQYGTMGYMGYIGTPFPFWTENCPTFAKLMQDKPFYGKNCRKFYNLCKLARFIWERI